VNLYSVIASQHQLWQVTEGAAVAAGAEAETPLAEAHPSKAGDVADAPLSAQLQTSTRPTAAVEAEEGDVAATAATAHGLVIVAHPPLQVEVVVVVASHPSIYSRQQQQQQHLRLVALQQLMLLIVSCC
jgi:hypothetical protein